MSNIKIIVYLIFTSEGFEEALTKIIEHKAYLWINDDILNAQQKTILSDYQIDFHILESRVEATDEQAIISAIKSIDKRIEKAELFVEFL